MAVSCGTQGSTLEAKRGLPSLSRSRVRSVSLPRSRRVSSTGVGAAPSSTGTEGPKSSSCKRSEQCLPISRPSNLGAPGPEHRRVRPPTGNHDARGPRIGSGMRSRGINQLGERLTHTQQCSPARRRILSRRREHALALALVHPRKRIVQAYGPSVEGGMDQFPGGDSMGGIAHTAGGPRRNGFCVILVSSFRPSSCIRFLPRHVHISPTSSPPSLPLPTIGVNVNQHARAVRNNAAPRKERVAWTPAAKDADAQDVGAEGGGGPGASYKEYGSVFEMEPAAKAKTQPNAWKSTSPACDLVVRYAGVLRAPVGVTVSARKSSHAAASIGAPWKRRYSRPSMPPARAALRPPPVPRRRRGTPHSAQIRPPRAHGPRQEAGRRACLLADGVRGQDHRREDGLMHQRFHRPLPLPLVLTPPSLVGGEYPSAPATLKPGCLNPKNARFFLPTLPTSLLCPPPPPISSGIPL
ncbi:hypothetical protein K438DRAFT_1786653 [Mycena galopus ATCC 62051]|nr:hypothetical protein K438DRAFT_1786653 [Mycena galopus ATCC 62051]